MNRLIDITGQKFGRWTVISHYHNNYWTCRCDCGTIRHLASYDLRIGETQSCGCYQKERASETHKKHGYTGKRLYRIYHKIRERCYRPNNRNYKYYGGRGITICDEWYHNFQAFMEWSLSHGYTDDLTIDRIDNEKGYAPDNCRWVTMQRQNCNRRNNHLLEFNGQTKTVSDWSRETGIKQQTILHRINRMGWGTEKALTTPVRDNGRRK